MNHNIWHYIQQHMLLIEQLQHRLTELEKQIDSQSGTRIEKIEYKFDQLKIERLEGTLQIGITPDEIESFSQDSPLHQDQQIQADLYNLLPRELDRFLQHYHIDLAEQDKASILTDLNQQLPKRIGYYQNKKLSTDEIKQVLIKDMRQSLADHFEDKGDDGHNGGS
ncbi:spore germination protein GerPC [Amphibacillus jilinensis]|uniref:spore germination protein GerPC n=1 Tax=Amphibacillus jilinensis TaxID=1216008 RepID=UPI0002D46579|nr:spore germination protein GerPC [Amphibacillus jilinensis]